MKSKVAVLAAIIMLFGILSSGCGLIEKTPEAIAKEKVAKVGNEYITRGELDEMMVPTKVQIAAQNGGDNYLTSDDGKKAVLDQEKQMLQNMIESKVLEQKAKSLKLFKDDKEIDDQINTQMANLAKAYGGQEDLDKELQAEKISSALLKKLLRIQVIGQKVYDNTIKDAKVTDDEIKKYYDTNKDTITEKTNTMQVSHILVGTEQEAKDIKAKLDKGEDFAALAKQYSTDTGSKDKGGALGEIQYNDPYYEPTFVQAAMKLNEGQVSDPVQTKYGFHIIKVTKKTIYPIVPFDQAKEGIKEQLLYNKQQQTYKDALAKWKTDAKIKIMDKTLQS